jgi:hypothetical protein
VISGESAGEPVDYPLLAIERGGFVQMIPSADYWRTLPLGFVKIYRRRLNTLWFYDKTGTKWRLLSVSLDQTVGPVGRVVGLWLGLSMKPVATTVAFQAAGAYALEELRSDFRSAVEADDDILCQYYDREQILAWLDDAQSVAKIFNLYNWITKRTFRKSASSRRSANRER